MSVNLLNLFPEIQGKHYFQDVETKEFWFHATGVCNALGFKNPGRTLGMYCDDDERFQDIWEGKATWFVSESGVYGLAMASKTEAAKKFKRWVKHEVLPKLRADGGYVMPTATSEQLEALQGQITKLTAKNNNLKSILMSTNIETFLWALSKHIESTKPGFTVFGAKQITDFKRHLKNNHGISATTKGDRANDIQKYNTRSEWLPTEFVNFLKLESSLYPAVFQEMILKNTEVIKELI